jgi:hypothetical protein
LAKRLFPADFNVRFSHLAGSSLPWHSAHAVLLLLLVKLTLFTAPAQSITITNPAPASSDFFGGAVTAVGADRLLIGADGDNTGANDAGVAYLISTNGALLVTLTNPAPVSGDAFGQALAMVGTDKLLIGAPLKDIGSNNSGVAYLFSTNGTLLTTITNPTPAGNDFFGSGRRGRRR